VRYTAHPTIERVHYQGHINLASAVVVITHDVCDLEADVTNNKPAFLVFCGLIIASAVIWISITVSLAVATP
jgi:hypothetical protein